MKAIVKGSGEEVDVSLYRPEEWVEEPGDSFGRRVFRRDALLEWLIEQRDCSVYTDQDAYEAFQEIIDKINLM